MPPGVSTNADVPATTPTTSTTKNESANQTLTPGSKAGIGIGAAALALIVLGLIACFFLRRRRSGKPKSIVDSEEENENTLKTGLADIKKGDTKYEKPELDVGTPRVELDATKRARELDASAYGNQRFELPDSRARAEME